MLPTRDSFHSLYNSLKNTQSEKMEKDIQYKWKQKECWGSNIILDNRLQNKDYKKIQGRALHNDKGVNPRRGYNIQKYLCTQHRST